MKRKYSTEEVDRLMKGRLFCNPDDLNIFVRRRVPFAWTMNLGNKWAWGIMGFGVLAVAAIVWIIA